MAFCNGESGIELISRFDYKKYEAMMNAFLLLERQLLACGGLRRPGICSGTTGRGCVAWACCTRCTNGQGTRCATGTKYIKLKWEKRAGIFLIMLLQVFKIVKTLELERHFLGKYSTQEFPATGYYAKFIY